MSVMPAGPASTSFPSSAQTAEPSLLPTQKQFFFLLAAYFGLHVLSRALVSETVAIDEADQLVLGQKLSWGYGPQAPLYTWLMIFFLKTFGYSVFSLMLLREAMLFGIYALTYFNARRFAGSHVCGIAAAAALQFHPSIVWEAQRELTHSLAASLMILATLLAFQTLRKERLFPWIVFGVCAGLATLSKYNAALVYAALLLSALTLPEFRSRVLDWRMGLATAICLLVVLPNAIWAVNHLGQASVSLYKLRIQPTTPWVTAVTAGLRVWLQTAAAHLATLSVLFAVLFWRPIFRERVLWRSSSVEVRLLWRVFLILNLLVVLAILFFKITAFKDRWLQPIFIWFPILLVLWVQPHLGAARLKTFLGLAGAMTVAMALAIPGRLFFTEWRGRRDVLNAPFRKFAMDLSTSARTSECLVSDGYWLGGNMILWFPDKSVYTLDLAPPPKNLEAKSCLVVWDATRRSEPSVALLQFAKDFTGREVSAAPAYFEEKWKYHESKKMRLGVLRLARKRHDE